MVSKVAEDTQIAGDLTTRFIGMVLWTKHRETRDWVLSMTKAGGALNRADRSMANAMR